MKKIFLVIAVLMVMMWPAAAFADGSATLSIDDANIYAGMSMAYKDGYTPSVADGKATIVLPLIATGDVAGNVITATPQLGDAYGSPFVFSNYQKTIQLANNAVGNGTSVPSYLVRFDLPLASGRINGVYPVMIEVQATDMDGSLIQQMFTVYVTITDGKKPASEPKPEKAKPQPKVIVSGYRINPSPVIAGDEFTATVTLTNTSETQGVQNMALSVSSDSFNFSLQNESSTLYLGKLAKSESIDVELKYKTDLETPAQRYHIMLSLEYDNSDAMTLGSSGMVPVQVSQPLRVELEMPQVPMSVNAGDTMPLSFQVMNLSRTDVYNVRIMLSAPGLIPSNTAFIGNMPGGTAMPADMDVFVGTKNMSEGYEDEEKYGFTNGVITLIYEDENGQEYSEETTFHTLINAPVIRQTSGEPAEETKTAGQWWISIAAGVVVIAVLVALLLRKKKRGTNEDI